MSKKSAAQIRRMEKRAAARGDAYEAPIQSVSIQTKLNAAKKLKEMLDTIESNDDKLNSRDKRASKRKAEAIAMEEVGGNMTATDLLQWYEEQQPKGKKDKTEKNEKSIASQDTKTKFDAYKKYTKALSDMETDQTMNAKDRRSAKRKAEAIACENSNFSNIQELLDWYEANSEKQMSKKPKSSKEDDFNEQASTKKKSNPYILFVGQIPFDATAEQIMEHFQHYMGKKVITNESMKIRIPSNENKDEMKAQGKDRPTKGFAFCEFQDPELMYECLKLHHTDMNGRRINVIRAAGGGKAKRAEKIKERNEEQDQYISTVVDKIMQEHISKGNLKEGELDYGAVLLCRRRNAAIVEAALSEYIEARKDRHFDNPSSYFATIMSRVTSEGADATKKKDKKQDSKRFKSDDKTKKTMSPTKFAKLGVDMSASFGSTEISNIFPSMAHRGRGRGRGAYMR